MFQYTEDVTILVFLTCLIATFSVIGDRILKTNENQVSRAMIDNLTHAIVGGLSWIIILILLKKSLIKNLFSIASCFILASVIDLDHFLTAKSYKLSVAVNLRKRPFLHCSIVPITLSLILILCSKLLNSSNLNTVAWIILTAFLSHHLRDGNRRGLWFYPFGSTQPIPYFMYLSLNMVLPYILYILMTLCNSKPFEKALTNNIV